MSQHEPIPFCDGSGQDACVACSEEADTCVAWPCIYSPEYKCRGWAESDLEHAAHLLAEEKRAGYVR